MKFKEYKYKINGTKFTVKVGELVDNNVQVEVNGTPTQLSSTRSPHARQAYHSRSRAQNPLLAPKAERK